MKIKLSTVLAIIFGLLVLGTTLVKADGTETVKKTVCTTTYGGGTECYEEEVPKEEIQREEVIEHEVVETGLVGNALLAVGMFALGFTILLIVQRRAEA